MAGQSYRKHVLSNGMTLVAEVHPHARSVSAGLWVRTGSVDEKPSVHGISHFIEHMVFKGTTKRTPFEIVTHLERFGGDLNAFTDREATCYYATAPEEYLDNVLDILSDIVLNPTFPDEQLGRERKVLLQELAQIEDSPDDTLYDLVGSLVWHGHPLGKNIIGSRASLKNIDRKTLIRYYQKHYSPAEMVLSVAGKVDWDGLKDSAEKYIGQKTNGLEKLSDLKKVSDLKRDTRKASFNSIHRYRQFETDQSHLLVAYPAPHVSHEDRYTALVVSMILGGGMSSRLFQKIREEAGLAYSVDCDYQSFRSAGMLSVYTGLDGREVSKCLRILGQEFEKLTAELVSPSELERVQGQLSGSLKLSLDQMESRQESLGRNELVFSREVSIDEILAGIRGVSLENIRSFASSTFRSDKETVVLLGPRKISARQLRVLT